MRGRRRIRSPPAHGANDKHKTTYPSLKRGGIGGARSLPPPVADFTSSVRLAPATFPRGEGSGSVLRVGISKQSRPAPESSAPEADRSPRQRATHDPPMMSRPSGMYGGAERYPEPRGDEHPRCGIKRIGSGLNRRNFRTISVREGKLPCEADRSERM